MKIDPTLGIILECGNRERNIKKTIAIGWKEIKYVCDGFRFEATDKAVTGFTSYNEALTVGVSRDNDAGATLERWGIGFDGREWSESMYLHFTL